ncbi:MAG: hypothetical protein Faunusvirus45_5 [Faunusvirus sp.]|jgi:TPR repeat protein|uniref:Sel1 repeat family protein n=1 Tax=Faunusvirus sp. TaxID=2487766 RepID=A0A3G4ZXV0_9VIRU|nr:MAG: hypothetical protein Faunusvirus45_5 [Faunusvirus sp.]
MLNQEYIAAIKAYLTSTDFLKYSDLEYVDVGDHAESIYNMLVDSVIIPVTKNTTAAEYYYLAIYYKSVFNDDEMVKYYMLADDNDDLTTNTRCPEAAFQLGNYYDDNEKYDEMIHYYEEATECDHIKALIRLGSYYKSQSNIRKMMDYFRRAIELGDMTPLDIIEDTLETMSDKLLIAQQYRDDVNAVLRTVKN